MRNIIRELQRRNVFKAAISYAVFAWVFIQVASILYPVIGWGSGGIRITLIVLIIGFPLWLIFAYIFEWTPDGFKKTTDVEEEASVAKSTSKKMNAIIIAGLSLAILLLVADRIFYFTGDTKTTVNDDKSIAVMAFADMSPEKDQEYFSDGISEEILNLLAKIPELKVVSRTSSFSYKGKEQNIKAIGKELNVGHVLEGSIRKSGNTFRITTQLIDVATGLHIWSETFDRRMEDIFIIQDEIAAKVTDKLKVSLLGTFPVSKTVNPQAYNLYLQAKQLLKQMSPEGTKNACQLIKEAIAIDSSYAPSWSFYGGCFLNNSSYDETITAEEANKKGRQALEKAIELDSTYIKSYLNLSSFEKSSWNFKATSQLIEKASSIEPNSPAVYGAKSFFAASMGNNSLAISSLLLAKEIDPKNDVIHLLLGSAYWESAKYAEAEEYAKYYLLLYPNSSAANSLMSTIQLSLGHPKKAMLYNEKDDSPFSRQSQKAMIEFSLGNKRESSGLLKKLITDWGQDYAPDIAYIYAFFGEKEQAFKYLDLAFEAKDASLLEVLDYPKMEILWSDPRWNNLIKKLSLPKDHGFHVH